MSAAVNHETDLDVLDLLFRSQARRFSVCTAVSGLDNPAQMALNDACRADCSAERQWSILVFNNAMRQAIG